MLDTTRFTCCFWEVAVCTSLLSFALGAAMTPDKKAQHEEIYFLVNEQGPVSCFSYELC